MAREAEIRLVQHQTRYSRGPASGPLAASLPASRHLRPATIGSRLLQKANELIHLVWMLYQLHKRRQTVRRLLDLDERLLDDVGMTPDDVREARRRWWV